MPCSSSKIPLRKLLVSALRSSGCIPSAYSSSSAAGASSNSCSLRTLMGRSASSFSKSAGFAGMRNSSDMLRCRKLCRWGLNSYERPSSCSMPGGRSNWHHAPLIISFSQFLYGRANDTEALVQLRALSGVQQSHREWRGELPELALVCPGYKPDHCVLTRLLWPVWPHSLSRR